MLTLLLAACAAPPPIVATCNNPITEWPANNAADVFRDSEIAVHFAQGIEADPTLTLEDDDGPVAGVVVADPDDALRIRFVPDEPLATSTRYHATLDWSCGTASWEFATSDVGDPVGTPAPATYRLAVADAVYGPEGLQSMLGLAARSPDPLLLAIAPADTGVSALFAPTRDVVQTRCATTAAVDATYDDPTIRGQGLDLWLRDATFEGTLAPGGERMQGVRLAGEIDARELFGDPEGCSFLSVIGAACRACSDGSGRNCFTLEASDIPTWRVDQEVVPRSAEDVAALCP